VTPAVEVRRLSYSYPDQNRKALDTLSLSVNDGEFVAVVGENGSGKTTLLRVLLGILRPQVGEVRVAGRPVGEVGTAQLAAQVGLMLQNPDQQLFADRLEDEVAFGPRNLGLSEEEVAERVEEALRTLRLEGKRDEFPLALPRGERARAVLAAVLAMRPSVLVLDEPTIGQDLPGTRQVMAAVKEFQAERGCVVMATHEMAVVAEYATRILVLHRGTKWMDGTPREVFAQPDRLAEANVHPPQITRLGQALEPRSGAPRDALTVEEMERWVLGELAVRAPEEGKGGGFGR